MLQFRVAHIVIGPWLICPILECIGRTARIKKHCQTDRRFVSLHHLCTIQRPLVVVLETFYPVLELYFCLSLYFQLMMSHQNTTGELTVLQCACKRTRQLQRLHVSLDETIRTHFRILQEKNLSQSAQIQATRACMKLFLAFLEEEEANTISMQFDRALLLEVSTFNCIS